MPFACRNGWRVAKRLLIFPHELAEDTAMSRAIRKACSVVILTADLYREMVASAIRLFRPDSYHWRSAS